VEGTETTITDETTKKEKKVLRKIPPKIIQEAGESHEADEREEEDRRTSSLFIPSLIRRLLSLSSMGSVGLCVFTSFRTGIMPMGGAGESNLL